MGVGALTRPAGFRKAVFLDRDGVLNEAVVRDGKPYPPDGPADLRIVAGAVEALDRLRRGGFLLVVVTNQPDVARGKQERETVEAMHGMLRDALPIDDIFTCYHTGEDQCHCRKPLPGMILEAARKHSIDVAASFLIGDRWRDIEAGQAAGCRTVWIDCGYRERGPSSPPDARAQTIGEAAQWVLGNAGPES